MKLYIYNPEQNISTLYTIMKNKYTVRNTFLYENVALYTFIILFASIETFVILHTIAIVYGTFFFKLQIISILYALIKYNKIGSTFRKIYAQQIKQNTISTNSHLVMEKKKEMSLLP